MSRGPRRGVRSRLRRRGRGSGGQANHQDIRFGGQRRARRRRVGGASSGRCGVWRLHSGDRIVKVVWKTSRPAGDGSPGRPGRAALGRDDAQGAGRDPDPPSQSSAAGSSGPRCRSLRGFHLDRAAPNPPSNAPGLRSSHPMMGSAASRRLSSHQPKLTLPADGLRLPAAAPENQVPGLGVAHRQTPFAGAVQALVAASGEPQIQLVGDTDVVASASACQ